MAMGHLNWHPDPWVRQRPRDCVKKVTTAHPTSHLSHSKEVVSNPSRDSEGLFLLCMYGGINGHWRLEN